MVCCRKSRSPDTLWSWVVCLSATMNNFLHFGISMSFGVFLPVLSENFNEKRAQTAWVGSIAMAFTMFFSPFAIILTNLFGHRATAMGSGLLCVVSLVSSSYSCSLSILYFSYGVLFGVGAGCILNSGFTINYLYFKGKPALAFGIISTGASLGVIVFGPCLEELIQALQWRNTFRVMAGVMVLVCVLSTTYDPVKNDVDDHTLNELKNKRGLNIKDCLLVFSNCTYTIGLIAHMLTYLGLYVPFVHLVQFAKDLNISSRDGAQLYIYIGISSTLSRIAVGRVLDKAWLTSIHCLQLMSLIVGLSIIFLAFAKEYSHFVIFAIVNGIGNGGFISNSNVFFMTVVSKEKSSVALGMGYMLASITVCGGPPFAGFIADEFGSYIPSFYVAGGIVLFAALLPLVLLFCHKGSAEYRCEIVNATELPDDSKSDVPVTFTSKKAIYISSV